jgi:hypothetical protein
MAMRHVYYSAVVLSSLFCLVAIASWLGSNVVWRRVSWTVRAAHDGYVGALDGEFYRECTFGPVNRYTIECGPGGIGCRWTRENDESSMYRMDSEGVVVRADPVFMIRSSSADKATSRRFLGLSYWRVDSPLKLWEEPQRPLLLERGVYGPYWLIALASAILPMTALTRRRPLLRRKRGMLGLCPACGYDLRFSTERCPECGRGFDRRTVIRLRRQ